MLRPVNLSCLPGQSAPLCPACWTALLLKPLTSVPVLQLSCISWLLDTAWAELWQRLAESGKGKGGSRLPAVLYMVPPVLLKLLHPLTDRDHPPPRVVHWLDVLHSGCLVLYLDCASEGRPPVDVWTTLWCLTKENLTIAHSRFGLGITAFSFPEIREWKSRGIPGARETGARGNGRPGMNPLLLTFSRFRLPLFVFLYCTYVLVL